MLIWRSWRRSTREDTARRGCWQAPMRPRAMAELDRAEYGLAGCRPNGRGCLVNQDAPLGDDQGVRGADRRVSAGRKAGRSGRRLFSRRCRRQTPGGPGKSVAAYNLERMMVHGARRAAEMGEVAATLRDLGLARPDGHRPRRCGRTRSQNCICPAGLTILPIGLTVSSSQTAMKSNLRHLRVFAAVIETESITRAAERVLVSQPAVTQAVAKLENILCQPLLLRTSQSVFANPAGKILANRINRAFSILDPAY